MWGAWDSEGTDCEGARHGAHWAAVVVGPHALVTCTQMRFDLEKRGSGASSLSWTPCMPTSVCFPSNQLGILMTINEIDA